MPLTGALHEVVLQERDAWRVARGARRSVASSVVESSSRPPRTFTGVRMEDDVAFE